MRRLGVGQSERLVRTARSVPLKPGRCGVLRVVARTHAPGGVGDPSGPTTRLCHLLAGWTRDR